MNKTDLINEVSQSTGLSKTKSSEVIDAVFESIQSSLSKGEKVSLIGFGNWETLSKPERIARNPKTGEEVNVPAKKVTKFKPGTGLNKAINE